MVFDDIEQWTGIYCTPQFTLNLFAWHPRTDMRWQRPIKYELNHPALYPPPKVQLCWAMTSGCYGPWCRRQHLGTGHLIFEKGGCKSQKNISYIAQAPLPWKKYRAQCRIDAFFSIRYFFYDQDWIFLFSCRFLAENILVIFLIVVYDISV